MRLRRAVERRGGGVAEGKERGGGDSAVAEEGRRGFGGGRGGSRGGGELERERGMRGRRLQVFWFIYFLKKG
jgi:hypothetical protein